LTENVIGNLDDLNERPLGLTTGFPISTMIPRSMGTATNRNRVVAMSTSTTTMTTWSQVPHPHGFVCTCNCGGIQSKASFAVICALVFRGFNAGKPTSSSRPTLTYLSRIQFGQPTSSAAQTRSWGSGMEM
jgi:hypothetical protein